MAATDHLGGAIMVMKLEVGRARAHSEISDEDMAVEILDSLLSAGYKLELTPDNDLWRRD